MFIGREKELRFLQDKYDEKKGQLIVLYGRRRVGKTETLREFCRDKPHLFFFCTQTTDRVQLARFSSQILREDIPAKQYLSEFADWEKAFRAILDLPYGEKKKLIVIDEFPYMCKGNKSIPSILQNLWDMELKDGNVMIVLCGSAMSFVEKELLAAQQDLNTSAVSGELADVKYQSSLTGYENALSKAQRELEEAAEKLEAFDKFVGDGTVFAEGSGIVTEIGYEAGDYLMNTGTLVAFAKADEMTVSVDVSQEDVVAMKVGDAVELNFSAYEGETYHGVIESVTTTATSRNSATISYPVVVSIQGDTSMLYSGMTAEVTFVTEQAENISYVLRKAVVEENGKSQLFIKSGEAYVLTPVTTGFHNGEYIEVIDGISAGDKYYIKTLVQKGGADEK